MAGGAAEGTCGVSRPRLPGSVPLVPAVRPPLCERPVLVLSLPACLVVSRAHGALHRAAGALPLLMHGAGSDSSFSACDPTGAGADLRVPAGALPLRPFFCAPGAVLGGGDVRSYGLSVGGVGMGGDVIRLQILRRVAQIGFP